jgi:hypothetical protein
VLGEVIEREVGVVGELDAVPMVIPRTAEAVCPVASVTAKVKALVPALAGFPDKRPDVVKPRPVLQEPEQALTAHV